MTPARRLWLYPVDVIYRAPALEIFMFGPLADIGPLSATVKTAAERWQGFVRVAIVSSGTTVAGLAIELSNLARSTDPVVEGLEMLNPMIERGELPRGFGWRSPWVAAGANPAGMIGTW